MPSLSLFVVVLLCGVASGEFCDFTSHYPYQYVSYFASAPPVLDGKLDEPFWEEVAWTQPFLDISGPSFPTPRFLTHAKIRWDNTHLYVGAVLNEPQVWANLTQHDSVIFQDNDFEVFLNPDGSSHYYKEFEMNAFNTVWNLCLNKPYLNGGYENSSRVFGNKGWDDPELKSAVYVDGKINDPAAGPDKYWSVEVAFPLAAIALNNSVTLPPKNSSYWRINFSRVEWHVKVVDNKFVKVPNVPEDNWVLAPTYIVDIHLPEYWAYLQFSTDAVNATGPVRDPDWTIRFLAMQVYYAQLSYFKTYAAYTDDISKLSPLTPVHGALEQDCTRPISIHLRNGTQEYTAELPSLKTKRTAFIRDDRYLIVRDGS
eukprot:m.183670 g.183670  ORF g.183670 m.183670 type:complete len:370 (-) comp25516_c0_seq5:78-1187(-)